MKKYINIPARFKNPWFWVGIVGVIFSAMQVDPYSLTSWSLLWVRFLELIHNPAMLVSVFLAVLGVFVDPTTHGFKDSHRALGYDKPFKDVEV